MDIRVEPWRSLSAEELMLLNCSVGEDSWESLWLQGDQTVNPKGNQPWIFIGRTYAKAEAPILWSLDVRKANSLKMILMLGNVEGKRRLRATGDKIVEWHHWLNVCEFDQTRGDSEGQGNLCAAVHGVAKSQIQLNDWTTIQTLEYSCKATKKTQIPRFSNISKECSELWWMKWPVNFRVVDKFQC